MPEKLKHCQVPFQQTGMLSPNFVLNMLNAYIKLFPFITQKDLSKLKKHWQKNWWMK